MSPLFLRTQSRSIPFISPTQIRQHLAPISPKPSKAKKPSKLMFPSLSESMTLPPELCDTEGNEMDASEAWAPQILLERAESATAPADVSTEDDDMDLSIEDALLSPTDGAHLEHYRRNLPTYLNEGECALKDDSDSDMDVD